jgi:hypothetical protein
VQERNYIRNQPMGEGPAVVMCARSRAYALHVASRVLLIEWGHEDGVLLR